MQMSLWRLHALRACVCGARVRACEHQCVDVCVRACVRESVRACAYGYVRARTACSQARKSRAPSFTHTGMQHQRVRVSMHVHVRVRAPVLTHTNTNTYTRPLRHKRG